MLSRKKGDILKLVSILGFLEEIEESFNKCGKKIAFPPVQVSPFQ